MQARKQKPFLTLLIIFSTKLFHIDLLLHLFPRFFNSSVCMLQSSQLHVAEIYNYFFFNLCGIIPGSSVKLIKHGVDTAKLYIFERRIPSHLITSKGKISSVNLK